MNNFIKYYDEKRSNKKLNEATENRYVVTMEVELYMYDKDDKAVIKQAEKVAKSMVKSLQKIDDNDATVEVSGIVEQTFGTLGNRKVK